MLQIKNLNMTHTKDSHVLSENLYAAPIGFADTAGSFQRGGLACAVTAHKGKDRTLGHFKAGATKNVGAVLFVSEPNLAKF